MVACSTVRVDGRAVQTKLTARSAVARRWLYTTLWRHRRTLHSAAGLTVGLDVQWTPPFGRLPAGAEPRPGTLQLCAGNRCLVFQLAQAARVPRILRRFLADARVTFAAYNVGSDRRKIYAHHGLEVRSVLELRGAAGMGNASLADMASRLLRIHGIRTSKWDGLRLSPEQVRYASIDAYISCCLGVYLRRRAMASEKSETESSDDDTESTASESTG
ncbi:hypothetical protein GQ55_4G073000 [Panicum hallii var. hallii]|uniref:3'-5' exonuclease domain-containing protein n=1 Tax=Panicum hallii var. hallii TaxID=1504633 RepID=A0A2T7DW57_9POAL|nr:hypothetical protein GQ55_4G073000 [Panicum hallii var. hallii]